MLDQYQEEVVHFQEGPALVLAGPGAGKTTCIMERICYLTQECQVSPFEILVITFTKDAAMEMRQRFRRRSPDASVHFVTFHSLFYHFLCEHPKYKQYGVLQGKQREHFYSQVYRDAIGTMEGFSEEFYRDVVKFQSGISKDMFSPNSMEKERFLEVQRRYEERKAKARKIDFEDMLVKTKMLFLEDPAYLQKCQNRFRYILIDEAQDMNLLQFELITMLCKTHNIMAVGDDDQSIYGFRGANPKVLKQFEDYYGAKVFWLRHNYRSLPEIVKGSLQVIQKNPDRYEKEFEAVRKGQGCILQERFFTEEEEVERVIVLCKQAMEQKETLGILFRNRADANRLFYRLLSLKIPFYTKEQYRQPFSDVVSRRLEDMLRHYGAYERDGDMDKLCRSFWGELFRDDSHSKLALQQMRTMSCFALLNYIRKGLGFDAYLRYISETEMQYQEYLAYAEEFQAMTRNEKRIQDVLQSLEKMRHFYKQNAPVNPEGTYVRLYTFHGSKGLEFRHVIVLNVNDGITPSKRAKTPEELQEERRMFYVAMTRAEDSLSLFSIQRKKNEILYPSVFVKDLTCPQADLESRQNA